ncbi:MAG: dTDP-glucose 4,6-dehydratase [Candidatus Cloacimonetes bacterium]|nr:dTDP-glucose 4,6-dehydratase [Candidatus Cloacimonadota bacterium]MCF7814468.1 dTDP-glucose 4,6-dehydratase [Candidatus Cloacimonadota bacterium]MCF7869043.1 dTDP-glucose 4,6-dehydratase [Candidatus Cloacimonadota bacterium]MCF7884438.1 dTDP-glucose 4,6-dehydratase [Candidatus Cloacimonadota bacterium]
MKIVMVTGGAGFIGSNFIKYMLGKYPDCKVINFDKLTYAGNLENLISVEGDVANALDIKNVFEQFNPDYVVHFAAESHVDRSIVNPDIFLTSNIIGTQILLNQSRENKVKKFVQISTDEVYGSLPTGIASKEDDKLNPNNPYAASKASADLLIRVAHQTFKQPVNIIRACNNYGPFQFPEKLIPLMIVNSLLNEELPLYGDGQNIREWLHVNDHCKAIDLVLHKGIPGETYNVGTGDNWENLKLVEHLLQKFPESKSHIQFVLDRQGHDFRYALDSSKIQNELGWKPEVKFEDGLQETIEWYVNHQEWIEDIRTGNYLKYYDTNYAERMMEIS